MNYDAPLHVYEHLYRHELKEGHDPYHPIPGDGMQMKQRIL